jgi:hypothetical protein
LDIERGQVEKERALAGLPDGLSAELALALGGRVRLSGKQLRVDVGGLAAAGRGAAELRAVGGLALVEQQVIRFPVNFLAALQTESFRTRSPPAARGSPPLSLAWM